MFFYMLADIALSQKLQEELKFEQESLPEPDVTPDFLKAFLEQGVWSVSLYLSSLPYTPYRNLVLD